MQSSVNRPVNLPMPDLIIRQVVNLQVFKFYETGIRRLLQIYQAILLDDFCEPEPENLVRNTATYLPWLWLLVDVQEQVWGLSCLSDVIPGRHAFIHGLSHPAIRKHPAITQVSLRTLQTAFQHLGVCKVKAEIEGNNSGARGFCRRMGFTREARFKQDNRVAGQWQDVLVYSLFAEDFNPERLGANRQ